MGLQNLIENSKFILKSSDSSYTLTKKDFYYAQVQLGLVLLNLKRCDFVIYNILEHSYIVLNVLFDLKYCTQLLQVLKIIYFEKLLHTICELKSYYLH